MSKGLKSLNELKKRYGKNFSLNDDERCRLIETELKDYEELTSKPVILCGRTHGYTQALIDTICKNYKEVKITNLEDEKKLKALEIIKDICKLKVFKNKYGQCFMTGTYIAFAISQETYDILKKALL